MMNDTFDNFTLADLQENPITSKECHDGKVENNKEISFDDSLFLNSFSFQTPNHVEQDKKSENTEENPENNLNFTLDQFLKCSPILSPNPVENGPTPAETIEDNVETVSSDSSFNLEDSLKLELVLSPVHKSTPLITNNSCLSQKFQSLSVKDSNLINLCNWGLPDAVLQQYESRKITQMFPWQVECLNKPEILQDNCNLVYSAPTSAGKTLVAEILTIKTVFERDKKVIFILPYVSVVREKMFYFQEIFGSSGIRVEGFMGSYNPPGGFNSVKVAICTIEKANSLLNKLLQEKQLGDVGAIIIDEMHLLGDPSRGYLLELLLTKVKYVSKRDPSVRIQIVGMSATLPNLDTLAKWLDAQLYVTSFRPIPLYERALVSGEMYTETWEKLRDFTPLPELDTDVDNVLQLCLETINESCSILIFCPTKGWCENLALQISQAFRKIGSLKTTLGERLRAQIQAQAILQLFEQLKACPVGLDAILQKTASFGVAFHHAGLTMDERDIIESAFRSGTLRVLVATSTLSSGVNLPAKRVIIRTPIFHGKPLDQLTYRQMIGRAGRMGRDTSGESVLIGQKNEASIVRNLMGAQLQPIESCLVFGGRLKRAILEIVASEVASTPNDVQLFTECTLLSNQGDVGKDTLLSNPGDEEGNPIEDSLKFLVEHEFLRLQNSENQVKYVATALGKACLSSSIPPEDGLALFTELEKARKCLALDTELHLIYLVTPYSACQQWSNLDWMMYLNFWEKLPHSMRKVGELVGVRESYLVSATRGKIQTTNAQSYHKFLVHKRFFVALALQDLVNEQPLSDVCDKFGCNRGMLQSLQQSAATFAGMVTAFSKQLGWANIEILIGQFQNRLHFGIGRDLLDLMRLPFLNGNSARLLYNAGFETLVQLANSNVETIENVLHKVVPFQSGNKREGESDVELKARTKVRTIWITGKEGLSEKEAAELLLNSARNFLQLEMGLEEAKWDREVQQEQHDSALEHPSLSRLSTSDLFADESPVKQATVNSSSDFIDTSQDELYSPCVVKKRPRLGQLSKFQSPRKKHKFFANHSVLDKIEIVDVCAREELYKSFFAELSQKQCFSIEVAYKSMEERKVLIGVQNLPKNDVCRKFAHKSKQVEGFAVSWGDSTVYYVDVTLKEGCISLLKDILQNDKATIRMYDAKNQLKRLKQCCGVEIVSSIEDPKIADWLLEPDGREKDIQALILAYHPDILNLYKAYSSNVSSKMTFCTVSLITWCLGEVLKEKLLVIDKKLLNIYETETQCLKILAQMEIQGIGINRSHFTRIIDLLNQSKISLETKAYSLAGRRFSLSSSKDVKKLLNLKETGGTKKSVLEKNTNPLSHVILQWRKINTVITKMIQPLVNSIETDSRIRGSFIVHTSTGRISMHEPNLQCVAKNFDLTNLQSKEIRTISCREAFAAPSGHTLVSADYCQLELRILAHLSQDKELCKILRAKGDIFKSMAARWNQIPEPQVDDTLRQRCKQISYGIIYGMGATALAEQLGVEEGEAVVFMETFQNAYPALRMYAKQVVESCKRQGFVETIAGRRRFLPHINSNSVGLQKQAERQAVNTTIQGSAADLVKNTMIQLEKRCGKLQEQPVLVLHLHDELLYEVPVHFLGEFVKILKETMEDSVDLSIPFPVKVKTGPSWGQLVDVP